MHTITHHSFRQVISIFRHENPMDRCCLAQSNSDKDGTSAHESLIGLRKPCKNGITSGMSKFKVVLEWF